MPDINLGQIRDITIIAFGVVYLVRPGFIWVGIQILRLMDWEWERSCSQPSAATPPPPLPEKPL